MIWYNLRIGTYYIKYTALKPKEVKYPYCDKEGNILKYINGKFESGYFVNEATQEKHEQAFFLINGKPYAKLEKTKETDRFIEVDKNEVDDLIIEKEYVVDCPRLYDELMNSGKALKLGISFGGGGRFGSVKTYYAYIHTSELYKGFLFMSCGTTKKSEAMINVVEGLNQQKKLKELSITISGIDKAKVEDLIQL